MKLVIRLLATLLLFTAFATGTSFGISDQGAPEISRLWTPTDQGDKFTCTVSYIFPHINERMSWVVTAGHCAQGRYVKRNHSVTMLGAVHWRGILLGDPRYTEGFTDLAIGTVPDTRPTTPWGGTPPKLWLADAMPRTGTVYIHGFPAGIERISLGEILTVTSEKLPGSRLLAVKAGEIVGGSSGSPVLDGEGRVVAILWGVVPERSLPNVLPDGLQPGYDLVVVTPVERLHELMKILKVGPVHLG